MYTPLRNRHALFRFGVDADLVGVFTGGARVGRVACTSRLSVATSIAAALVRISAARLSIAGVTYATFDRLGFDRSSDRGVDARRAALPGAILAVTRVDAIQDGASCCPWREFRLGIAPLYAVSIRDDSHGVKYGVSYFVLITKPSGRDVRG